jgi:hypothetical protein
MKLERSKGASGERLTNGTSPTGWCIHPLEETRVKGENSRNPIIKGEKDDTRDGGGEEGKRCRFDRGQTLTPKAQSPVIGPLELI